MAITRVESLLPGTKFEKHLGWVRTVHPGEVIIYSRGIMQYKGMRHVGEVKIFRKTYNQVHLEVHGSEGLQFEDTVTGDEMNTKEGITIFHGIKNIRSTKIAYEWAYDSDRAESIRGQNSDE